MSRIQIIARDNGWGLSRDLSLLANALRERGHRVTITALRGGKLRKWLRPLGVRLARLARRSIGRSVYFDFNLMDERIRPEYFAEAGRNLLLPHPEWFSDEDQLLLSRLDGVLAKTRHAERIFRELGCTVHWVGFRSEDRLDHTVPREARFFHLAGRSENKGTQSLLVLWRQHPEWPVLTVVQNRRGVEPIRGVANIEHQVEYLDDATLKRLQNAHRFHLCPSETEGYGHYLAEAMSVGAVTITTDAEPMNELLQPQRGLLVPSAEQGRQRLAITYSFDPVGMEAAIQRTLAMSEAEQAQIGQHARAWFEANAQAFPQRLDDALKAFS